MDIRKALFAAVDNTPRHFRIIACDEGVFSSAGDLNDLCSSLGIDLEWLASEGAAFQRGDTLLAGSALPSDIARAEEILPGKIGKTSGIATAARSFIQAYGNNVTLVCGAWKKTDIRLKDDYRRAISTGGMRIRIADPPFLYLDKNAVRCLGGPAPAVLQGRKMLSEGPIVVQIRGDFGSLADEAISAANAGASIVMVDSGRPEDLKLVVPVLRPMAVKVAFSGNVTAKNLKQVISLGADIVDIGRAVIDAPLLDVRLDVLLP